MGLGGLAALGIGFGYLRLTASTGGVRISVTAVTLQTCVVLPAGMIAFVGSATGIVLCSS